MVWGIRSDHSQLGLEAMSKQVVVIDYGIGNVFSICNALSRIGVLPILSGDPGIIAKAERVILPGVGAFSKAMDNVRSKGLDEAIVKFIDTGRPFLGICIGMQMLMERSNELGEHVGLGLINGSVERIPNISISGSGVKIPHIGWAQVNNTSSSLSKDAFCTSNNHSYYYFVHSYMCETSSKDDLLATASYQGIIIAAVIGRDNILGVQFHPERSGPVGLNFLNSFISSN